MKQEPTQRLDRWVPTDANDQFYGELAVEAFLKLATRMGATISPLPVRGLRFRDSADADLYHAIINLACPHVTGVVYGMAQLAVDWNYLKATCG